MNVSSSKLGRVTGHSIHALQPRLVTTRTLNSCLATIRSYTACTVSHKIHYTNECELQHSQTRPNSCHVSTPWQHKYEKSMACCMSWNVRQWHRKHEWRNYLDTPENQALPHWAEFLHLRYVATSTATATTTTITTTTTPLHLLVSIQLNKSHHCFPNDDNHLLKHPPMHEPKRIYLQTEDHKWTETAHR